MNTASLLTYWVYILASRRHGTLYVGVTNSLERRVAEHKAGMCQGFTKRYAVDRLVWSKEFAEVSAAIRFEKQLKRWRRDWKVRLIEEENPHWDDLYVQMMAPWQEKQRSWVPDTSSARSGMTDRWAPRG